MVVAGNYNGVAGNKLGIPEVGFKFLKKLVLRRWEYYKIIWFYLLS